MSWQKICELNDLVEHSGRTALVKGKQVALTCSPPQATGIPIVRW